MKTIWPRVSVIIPIYNRESFLTATLGSIYKQDYPKSKIEVLLVDAGSTDKTLEIAKSFQRRKNSPVDLRIINISDPLARKIGEPGKVLGYKKMTGDYYFYLDSDAEFVSKTFVKDLIYPFLDDETIAGSFTRYMPSKSQNAYNRYVSYNELQLWSMLSYLLPTIKEVTVEKRKKYDVVKINPEKSPPIGMTFYRKNFLKKVITNPDNFNYVDVAIPLQLADLGHDKFAYVEKAGMYHFRAGLKREFWRQKRDVTITYLPVIGERKFNYINFKKPLDILKIVFWVIWVNLLIPSFLVGIYKTIIYKDWAGMYELPTNFILTNYIIFLFLSDINGRRLLHKIISGKHV
ncbi:MAG: glycosyltransferase [Patescibacteria group bacterium]